MHTRVLVVLSALIIAAAPFTDAAAQSKARVISTKSEQVGQGSARAYVTMTAKGGVPIALGVSFDAKALTDLPTEMNMTSRCFGGQCLGDYERSFTLPSGGAGRAVAPFGWVMVNWNAHGHGSPAPPPWLAPHFDIHFYIADEAAIRALRPGTCGEIIDCEDFKKATKPVPAAYVHPDHINVDAAVPAMGNHLIDSKSPELQPGGPAFTQTFIIGANEGKVAFYEPMITLEFLRSKPNACTPIKQPAAFEVAGHYPTKYCVRYQAKGGRTTVSLEGFARREKG